ncbi:MAB_1171c family putative transporter [Streptomyces sp. NPDC021100]|uniref:MAB_1171c family putative transporter n=1 Tax=Streptomyces sp. NPDC021100 TaxID=3365114 RepID=UPI0037AE44D1
MAFLFLMPLVMATLWKLYQLSRAPKNRALRSVALCLLCACSSYLLVMPGGASGVETVAGHGWAKIGQNVLLLAAAYFLMCFYLYSAADRASGQRRARREGLLVLLVIAAAIALGASAPDRVFAGSYATADMTVTPLAAFYELAGLYLLYALAAAAWWTRKYACKTDCPYSTGLWMAAAGMSGMAAACAIRAVFVLIRWQGGTIPQPLVVTVAFLLVGSVLSFSTGITYPSVRARATAIGIWLRHRRQYRQLAPLWQLLSEAYPEIVLDREPLRWDSWCVRGVHRRYERRFVEIRDGLVRISPYLGEDRSSDAAVLAGRLTEAAQAVIAERLGDGGSRRDAAAAPRPAVALAMPLQDGRDADVQQLVELSKALRGAALRTPRASRVTAGS